MIQNRARLTWGSASLPDVAPAGATISCLAGPV